LTRRDAISDRSAVVTVRDPSLPGRRHGGPITRVNPVGVGATDRRLGGDAGEHTLSSNATLRAGHSLAATGQVPMAADKGCVATVGDGDSADHHRL
jgi:hypothetical protein